MTINPDRACPHQTFDAYVEVDRLVPDEGRPEATPTALYATMRIRCVDCDEKFRWIGVQAGLRPDRPMCSPDETELRAPLRPASSDPDFGLGLPGYAITWQEERQR